MIRQNKQSKDRHVYKSSQSALLFMPILRRATCCRCELFNKAKRRYRLSLSGEERPCAGSVPPPAGRSTCLALHSVASHESSREALAAPQLAQLAPLCVVLRNKFDGKFVKFSERVPTNVAMCAIISSQTLTI